MPLFNISGWALHSREGAAASANLCLFSDMQVHTRTSSIIVAVLLAHACGAVARVNVHTLEEEDAEDPVPMRSKPPITEAAFEA